ncbi:triphosphoribosyl-dephospho-CoA synthase MdcB [Ancylobacter pratisalsi]|uniref:Probable 2-(5''-triphosphoribosyl)-3'-dephosphocoenzyme-A synthase n=1 Tax=Ancylobacter pratisalsi TaxID=1745854 RepID=A0A6P1YIZ4_9HYPH|nr:triphosphoribosyl-dephospho-CoA synthase MdcB [Ancylobacter pratisalsi]QIB32980.1 triphosphoribosyl-dephospho-CoA synthase MdcB [Ancylobacter pratisalsi]
MLATPVLSTKACEEIDRRAIWALHTEVRLYPKAGLVSIVDTGSHEDMDADTFRRSADALTGYFGEMARAGADGADFAILRAIGMRAERRMFAATGGTNTHRGAIFSLGLLAAAAGLCRSLPGVRDPLRICRTVERWGRPILESRTQHDTSHGAQVRARYGAPGAREEAASGFPTVVFHTLPAFRAAYDQSGSWELAALQAFYSGMAVLDDNNLLYRAGVDGLARARALAEDFLATGGMLAPGGRERAVTLHHRFVARRLSPGGSADLLIATLFLAAEGGLIAHDPVRPWA